jgi:hypothetical protein
VLGIAGILAALDALAGGDAGDEVFAAIGDEWDVEDRTLHNSTGSASGTSGWIASSGR